MPIRLLLLWKVLEEAQRLEDAVEVADSWGRQGVVALASYVEVGQKVDPYPVAPFQVDPYQLGQVGQVARVLA